MRSAAAPHHSGAAAKCLVGAKGVGGQPAMHIAAPEPWARRVGGPTLLPSHHTTQCVISVSASCTAPTALRPDGGGGRRKVCWLQTPSPPATTRSRHRRHSTINHRVRRGSGCERSPRQWLHAAARMRHAAAVHAMRHRRTHSLQHSCVGWLKMSIEMWSKQHCLRPAHQ